MSNRKTLTLVIVVFVLVGLVALSIPFVSSMFPTEASKYAASVRVPVSDIPLAGAYIADFKSQKALILRKPTLRVFLMPYYDGNFQLPNPTWDRPIVPCRNFLIDDNGFSCEDPNLKGQWNREATWDLDGKNLGSWMPDLQVAEFQVLENHVVLEP